MRRSRSVTARLLAAVALVGCGGDPGGARLASSTQLVAPEGVAARIDVHRTEGRPAIALVARDGDPVVGLAVVLLLDAPSPGAPWLAALLEARLTRVGLEAEARVTDAAVLVTWRGLETEGGGLAKARDALMAPVRGEELPPLAPRVGVLSGAAVAPGLEALAACAGLATPGRETWDPRSPRTVTEVEQLRSSALTASRTSLAAVGPAKRVGDVSSALERGPAWPEGTPVGRTPPAGGASVFQRSERGSHARRGPGVVVGLELPGASRAAALARALESPGAPLASQLRLLAPGFEVGSAVGVARAGGGGSCLRVELAASRPEAVDAVAAALASDTLRRAALGAPSPEERELAARAIVEADDPLESAARAAWWTTTGDREDPARLIAALAVDAAPNESLRGDLSREIDRLARTPDRGRSIEQRVRVESGQGAFRMLVGSPCATGLGSPVSAAEVAIGLVAVSRTGAGDVELEPFVDGDGAGLLARALPRRGEGPLALAERVGDAVARALAGPPPTSAALSEARGGLVEHASRRWGHPEGADALTRALSPDRPARVAPLGLEIPLMRADGSSAGLRVASLLRSPIRVAVLANSEAPQAEAAVRALARHLPPSDVAPCPAPAATARPTPGRTDVRVPGDEPFAQLSMGVSLRSAELADQAVALLEDPSGPVAAAAARVGASARASRQGEDLVLLDVRSAPERVDEAFTAIQSALAKLGRGELDAPTLARCRAAAESAARARAAEPSARLLELWRGVRATPPGNPRAAAAELAPERWILVVARPG